MASIEIQQTITDGNYANVGYNPPANYSHAQSITATRNFLLARIDLLLTNPSGASGTSTVKIYSDNSGQPSSTLLGTSAVVNESSITSTSSFITYNFTTPVSITAGSVYWFILDPGSYLINWYLNTSNPYSGGSRSYNGGTGWTNTPTVDTAFIVYNNQIAKTQPSTAKIANNITKTQTSTTKIANNISFTQTASAHIIQSGDILKRYDYKVYDGNTFLGLLPNVTSEYNHSQDINTAGSQITVEVGVSPDTSALPSTATIDDETGSALDDENDNTLLTEGAVNIVGVGVGESLIKNGNTVVVYEYNRFHPNGKVMFVGEIERWEASFGGDQNNEKISVLIYSSGQDLDNYIINTGSTNLANQTTDASSVTTAIYGAAFAQSLKPSSTINFGQMAILASVPSGSSVGVFFKLYQGDPTLDSISTLSGVTTYTVGGSNTLIDTSSTSTVSSTTPVHYSFTLPTNHLLSSPNQYYLVTFFDSYSGTDIVFETAATGFALTAPIDKLYYARGTTNNVTTNLAYDSTHPVMTVQILTANTSTTSTYTSSDPSTGMLESILDNYKSQGGIITYNSSSIDATGLSLTYTFNTATAYEGLQAALSLAPDGFYYYADLGTNILYFKQSSLTADIIVTKNRDINNLVVIATIENLHNTVVLSGGIPSGTTTNIYSIYKDGLSIAKYGQRLNRISDNRITLQTTANAVGDSYLAENKDESYQTTLTILDNMMDISTLKPGLIIGFRGYGTFVDNLLAQIVRLEYTPEAVRLTLGILPKRVIPAFEKITRGLIAQQTIANPTTPS